MNYKIQEIDCCYVCVYCRRVYGNGYRICSKKDKWKKVNTLGICDLYNKNLFWRSNEDDDE